MYACLHLGKYLRAYYCVYLYSCVRVYACVRVCLIRLSPARPINLPGSADMNPLEVWPAAGGGAASPPTYQRPGDILTTVLMGWQRVGAATR